MGGCGSDYYRNRGRKSAGASTGAIGNNFGGGTGKKHRERADKTGRSAQNRYSQAVGILLFLANAVILICGIVSTCRAIQTARAVASIADAGIYIAGKGNVINRFSAGELIKNKTLNDWRTHDGVDIAVDKGTDVLAAADGTVAQIKRDDIWGTVITISHADGIQSVYCGLSEIVPVKEGEKVGAKQTIGKVEGVPCEASEPSHIHFAMKLEGIWIDPLDMLTQ